MISLNNKVSEVVKVNLISHLKIKVTANFCSDKEVLFCCFLYEVKNATILRVPALEFRA